MARRVDGRPRAALDVDHLVRQTHGDAALEREVLRLFDGQCGRLATEILDSHPGRRGDAAHALVGAARAVGAWRLADLAQALERDRGRDAVASVTELLGALAQARRAARARARRRPDAEPRLATSGRSSTKLP